MTLQLDRRLLTVDDYHKMIEAGIFTKNDHVELLNGEIIKMSPVKSSHSGKVNRIQTLLVRLLLDKAIISVQNPITIQPLSEPEPDICVLKVRDDYYENSHPKGEDVILLIEVSDTTLQKDKTIKADLYARGGVSDYWIIDIKAQSIECHSNPHNGKFKSIELKDGDDKMTIPHFNIEIKANQLLG